MTAAPGQAGRGRRGEESVLLEVTTQDGRQHTVAALADASVAVLVDALVRLLVGDSPAGYHLVDAGGRRWAGSSTLRTLGVLHGSDVRLTRTDPSRRDPSAAGR